MFLSLTGFGVFAAIISIMSLWSLSVENRKKANRFIFKTLGMDKNLEEISVDEEKRWLISKEEKEQLFLSEEMRKIVDFFESVDNLQHIFKQVSASVRSMEANGVVAYIYGRADTSKRIIFNVRNRRVLEVKFNEHNTLQEIKDDLNFIDFQNASVFSTLLDRYLTSVFENKLTTTRDQQQGISSQIFVMSGDDKEQFIGDHPKTYVHRKGVDILTTLKEAQKATQYATHIELLDGLVSQIEYIDNLSSPFDVERQHRYIRLRNTLLGDLLQSYEAYSPSNQLLNKNKLYQALQHVSDEMDSLITHKNRENDHRFEKQVSLIKNLR